MTKLTLTERFTNRRQAFGTTFAAAPRIKETQEHVREWFDSGVDEAEIRRRLREEIIEDDDLGLRAFIGLNRSQVRLPAAKVVVALAKHYADKLGGKRIEALLAQLADSSGIPDWFADYHIAWYKTGSPPEMSSNLLGGVLTVPIGPKGDQTPIVIAVAGPVSDPEVLIEQFHDACYRAFPEAFARKQNEERDAERVRLYEDGWTDFDIARKELDAEGWPSTAANAAEYNWGVASRANAVWYARKRWLEHLANLTAGVPPNTD
jgi:hypothetical protein